MSLAEQDDRPELLQRSMTLNEFCLVEGISQYSYFKMRKLGYGPRELRVPGTDILRITHEARAEWHERLQSKEVQEIVRQEHERRVKWSRRAGKLSLESPDHISNVTRRKPGPKPGKKAKPPKS
jgi:hypothetical protein